MDRIAIVGLGLMGGSLGLALKRGAFRGKVAAYARREETRREAMAMGACDEVFASAREAVRGADLSVFCVPIRSIPGLMAECAGGFADGSIVTDVGSTKAALVKEGERLLKGTGVCFVGSHPIAGSEQQGLDGAVEDLYEGAVVVVTPGSGASEQKIAEVVAFWESLGAHVERMAADEHDRLMARTSHLPHIAAALVAGTVGRADAAAHVGQMCGTGFADTTRIAEGSPAVWRDIVETNAESLVGEVRAFQEALKRLIDLLERRDFDGIERLLKECRDARKALLAVRSRSEGRGGR